MAPAQQRNVAPHAEARARVNSDLRHAKVVYIGHVIGQGLAATGEV
jgi:hypothetical protein